VNKLFSAKISRIINSPSPYVRDAKPSIVNCRYGSGVGEGADVSVGVDVHVGVQVKVAVKVADGCTVSNAIGICVLLSVLLASRPMTTSDVLSGCPAPQAEIRKNTPKINSKHIFMRQLNFLHT
jgi:hypothetical protein